MKKTRTKLIAFLSVVSMLLCMLTTTGVLAVSAEDTMLVFQGFEGGTDGFHAWMVDGNATWGTETDAPISGNTSLRLSTSNAAGCYVTFPATIGVKDIALRLKVTGNTGIVRIGANGNDAHNADGYEQLTTSALVFTDVNGNILPSAAAYDTAWGGIRFAADFDGYVFIKNENNVDIQKINVAIYHGSTNAEGMTLLFDDFATYTGTDYAAILGGNQSAMPALLIQNFENGTAGFHAWMVDGNATWGVETEASLAGAASLKLSTSNAAGCYVTFPATAGVKNLALRLKVIGNTGIVRIGANGNDAHNADGYEQLTTAQFVFTDINGNVLTDVATYDAPWGGIRFAANFDGYVFIQNENAVDIQKINVAIFHGSTNAEGMTLLFDNFAVYTDHSPANFAAIAAQLNPPAPACEHEYFDECDPVCLLCGELREVSHNVIHVEENAPSCTENGNVEYWYCDKCGAAWLDEAGTIVTNLKAVKLGATCAANAVHNEGIPAGCHYTGMQENWYCATCDVYYLDAACTVITNYKSLTIPALGGEVEHFTAKDATCIENGNIEYWVCYECEQVWQDAALTQLTNIKNVVIGATGEHVYFNDCDPVCMNCWEITRETSHNVVYQPEVVATDCQTMGYMEHWYCDVCNSAWMDADLIFVTNPMRVMTGYGEHDYVDGICDLCGEIDPDYAIEVETQTIGTVTYTVMQRADGTYKVVISGTGTVEKFTTEYAYDEVIIEEGITAIAKLVFENNTALKNVTFPESLEFINNKAFMGSGLVSVTLADDLVLGDAVFMNCKSLESAYIGNIKVQDGDTKRSWIPTQTFANCSALTFVTFGDKLNTIKNAAFKSTGLEYVYIPANIGVVSNSAFDGCPNLVTVEIEEGVKTLAYRAFAGSKKLADVTVPASVTTMGAGVFRSCYGLENAVVNAAVAMKEDMFFDNRVLTSVTLADGTPSIDWRAFFKCAQLESIVIPESVTTIGKLAFYNCLALTEIVIPANVATIGENAFENCKALATVYVDSAAVAAGLTSNKAMGQLTRYATTVAFAEGIEAPAYIAENFTNVTTAEVDGILYTLYSK